MVETGVGIDHDPKTFALTSVLRECNIEFPLRPQTDTTAGPRQWLIRGEQNKNRLLHPKENPFTPQSGEWGSHGVFFGDCASSLMYPEKGAYYIFDTSSLNDKWIISPSREYKELLQKTAEEKNLNLANITGGVNAEQEVYKANSIFQSKRGIATVSHPILVQQAQRIIITDGFLSENELASIPEEIRRKIITLKLSTTQKREPAPQAA